MTFLSDLIRWFILIKCHYLFLHLEKNLIIIFLLWKNLLLSNSIFCFQKLLVIFWLVHQFERESINEEKWSIEILEKDLFVLKHFVVTYNIELSLLSKICLVKNIKKCGHWKKRQCLSIHYYILNFQLLSDKQILHHLESDHLMTSKSCDVEEFRYQLLVFWIYWKTWKRPNIRLSKLGIE